MWFAAGLAIAITSVWAFTAWRASAIGANESTFVPVTPVRILDTRDPTNVGLAGPFVSAVSQDLQVTGNIPTTTGNQVVVPAGATGVVMNVTAVSPTANGFLSIRPADAPGLPTTSSLNVVLGDILPNAVTVSLPTAGADAGKIEITFDAYGVAGPTVDVLIDVVGYNINSGLQELDTRLAAVETGQIVMSHGVGSATNNAVADLSLLQQSSQGLVMSGDGFANVALHGPIDTHGGQEYTLREVEYCIMSVSGGGNVTSVILMGWGGTSSNSFTDSTDRAAAGCFVVTPSQAVRARDAFSVLIGTAGGGAARVTIGSITSTWDLRSVLGVSDATDAGSDEVPELAGA
jgi:hypothetical protein